jgi:hypothetical protein
VHDKEITENEWKKHAPESLMCEDGWGDEESEGEDEEEDENDEEDLGSSDGLLLMETTHSCLDASCLCGRSSSLLEGIETAPLLEVTPIEVSTVLTMTHDIHEGHETRREKCIAPAFATGFWDCLMKTRAELELIESSSEQDSETEQDSLTESRWCTHGES